MADTTLRGLVVGDDPAAWRRAGFEVTGERLAVDGVTIRLAGGTGSRGIVAWTLDHPAPRTVDGIVHGDVGEPAPPAAHANGARLVDHVVITTPDVERTTDALGQLGLEPRRTVQALRGDRDTLFRFFLLGTCVLELVGPRAATDPAGPASFWGVAFVVDDLDATAAGLGALCGEPHDAVQPGRRIASLDHEAAGISVPVAFLTPRRGDRG